MSNLESQPHEQYECNAIQLLTGGKQGYQRASASEYCIDPLVRNFAILARQFESLCYSDCHFKTATAAGIGDCNSL